MQFHATLELNGKTATGIEVPPEVVAGLGSSKKPAVVVTINGYRYRSSVAMMGGRFLIPVSAEVREKVGVTAGDQLDVDLELDTTPREVDIPNDFQAALDQEAEAKRFFDGLSYSNKRRIVMPIEDAKTDETRQRRISKAVERLQAGQI